MGFVRKIWSNTYGSVNSVRPFVGRSFTCKMARGLGVRQPPRWVFNAARSLINTYVGAPAKAVDQSQQCDGCEDDQLEQGDAARIRERG